jgi:hypothetical protein
MLYSTAKSKLLSTVSNVVRMNKIKKQQYREYLMIQDSEPY